MRSYTLLFVNGRKHLVRGADAFLTLSDYLREKLKLCGTKIVCSEGDCGSCSVLCGKIPSAGLPVEYQPIDSCIRFVFQLDGCHIITVEGIAGRTDHNPTTREKGGDIDAESLSCVQRAMIDCHGSQCGYCTPGFVVAMTGILEQTECPSEADWREGLTGNLCRCTGYSPIIQAGCQAASDKSATMNERYPVAEMAMTVAEVEADDVRIESGSADESPRTVACPGSIRDATECLEQYPDSKIVSGGTDLGVQFNKGVCRPTRWLDLNRVEQLAEVQLKGDAIIAGASATWTDVGEVCRDACPAFYKIVSVFGSPQIRHVGTLGGNIINASPIADSVPFLMVCEAQLELQSVQGTRNVDVNDFYHGYKQFDLRPGELLTRISIPLPQASSNLRLYKVSRRRDMDISTFTAAIQIACDGDQITDAKIAYGAVGPVVLRLRDTEAFLKDRVFDLESMREAGEVAINEITPISDVRGSQDFRYRLARNVLTKFFHETMSEGVFA